MKVVYQEQSHLAKYLSILKNSDDDLLPKVAQADMDDLNVLLNSDIDFDLSALLSQKLFN